MRKFNFFCRCILLTGVAIAVPNMEMAVASEADMEHFAEADRNNDGKIDRAEYHQRLVDSFYFLDADKDGAIAPGEVKELSQSAFAEADTNSDKDLSLDEYVNSRFQDYHDADKDNNGVLVEAEVRAYQPDDGLF